MFDESSSWQKFWAAGGFWRALLLVAGYLALYLSFSWVVDLLWGDQVDAENPLATPQSVFVSLTAAIIFGIVLLFAFAWSTGTQRELFARQPIGGSWWMWILPIIVLVYNVLRFVATDYANFTPATVAMILFTGLCIGVAEEVLSRGFVVNLLRKGGHAELVVALLSSLLFAASHSVNIFSGQPPLTVGITVIYTFAFGVAMYFTLRVTRNLIWPILLHATTDPSLMLMSGGVDTVTANASTNTLAAIAGTANWAVILLGFILVWFIRGRVTVAAE